MIRVFLACAAVLIAASCGQPSLLPTPKLAEHVKGRDYRSVPLGLTVTRPDGWEAMTAAEFEELASFTLNSLAIVSDDEQRQAYEKQKRNPPYLFGFRKNPAGASDQLIPSVLALATPRPRGMSAAQFLGVFAPKIEQAQVKETDQPLGMKFGDGLRWRMIGGQRFEGLDARTDVAGRTIYKAMYVAVHGGDLVVFSLTWESDADRKIEQDIVDSIKLDWKPPA